MAEDSIIVPRKEDEGDVRYSCRCHTCSIEFTLIEELLDHVSRNHTNSDGRIECGECQDQFSNTEEYIEHYRTAHDANTDDYKGELSLAHSDIENSSELPNQITILNDDGETVGIAATQSRDDSSNLIGQSVRKRRPSAKIREILQHDSPAKKAKMTRQIGTPTMISSRSNEVEIDVSDVTSVRLKTKSNDRSEEIFQYLQRVDEKLDCILKHFNVPFVPLISSSALAVDGSIRQYKNSPKQQSRPSMVSNIRSQVIPIRTPYVISEANQQEITQYVISDDLLEATYLKSRNRGNFAKNLVYAAFPLDERLGRNCYGRRGGSLCGPKEPLEAAKLDAVREAVFLKFPVNHEEDEEAVWKRECVIAIDTALRSEMRHRILALNASNELKET